MIVLNPEIYWIVYWIILEWRWRSSHCVSFVTRCKRCIFYVVHEVWEKRDASDSFFAFPVQSGRQFLCRTQFVCIAASPRSFLRWLATPVLCAMLFDLFQKKCRSFNAFPLWHVFHAIFFSPGPQRPRLRARGHQRGYGTSLEFDLQLSMGSQSTQS